MWLGGGSKAGNGEQNFTCTDGCWFLFSSSAGRSGCWWEIQIRDHPHLYSHLLENRFSNSFTIWLIVCLLFLVPPLRCHVHLSLAVHPVLPYSFSYSDQLRCAVASSYQFSHACLNETRLPRRKADLIFSLFPRSFVHFSSRSWRGSVGDTDDSNLSFFGKNGLSNNVIFT